MSGQKFVDRINELFSRRIARPKSDFYESCKIPKNSLTNWAQRDTIPSADIALRIAKYLGTSVEYLVSGEEEKIPREVLDFAYETMALPPMFRQFMFEHLETYKRQLSKQEKVKTSDAV